MRPVPPAQFSVSVTQTSQLRSRACHRHQGTMGCQALPVSDLPRSWQAARTAPAVGVLGALLLGTASHGRFQHRGPGRGRRATVARMASVVAEVPKLGSKAVEAGGEVSELPGRPLQIVKIDLESKTVSLQEETMQQLQRQLARCGAQKLAVVGLIGAFRTGKSFLLDLILRYLNFTDASNDVDECEVPDWALRNEVPDWVMECGISMKEGRVGGGPDESRGFLWRPGLEKCTEGVWVWSEVFVRKAGKEDVAVLLMDTQGAWDAQMTKEQSATIFGLTTLISSRLVYNVTKQISQDKIDNLLYFTDFAQAALRTQVSMVDPSKMDDATQPFQTLEFLVRDWPYFSEGASVSEGRSMMKDHLGRYKDPTMSEDTTSMNTLQGMFKNIDVWCLPHPSLEVERETWNGDLSVIKPDFWRFLDGYLRRIFNPNELAVKTTLGTPLFVDTFPKVMRELITAFRDAAPQAKTFAEAMETSTTLLARDSAMQVLKQAMEEVVGNGAALAPKEFDQLADSAARKAEQEFKSKALFGTWEAIQKMNDELTDSIAEQLQKYREENERRLESALSGVTDISIVALGAFGVDKLTDISCDWWAPLCRDISTDLTYVYSGIGLFVLYSVFNVRKEKGNLSAAVATLELGKLIVKQLTKTFDGKR